MGTYHGYPMPLADDFPRCGLERVGGAMNPILEIKADPEHLLTGPPGRGAPLSRQLEFATTTNG